VDGSRPDTLERTEQRLEGIDGDAARRAAEEQLRGGGG
jgi:hypothetical protein